MTLNDARKSRCRRLWHWPREEQTRARTRQWRNAGKEEGISEVHLVDWVPGIGGEGKAGHVGNEAKAMYVTSHNLLTIKEIIVSIDS